MTGECSAGIVLTLVLRAQGHGRVGMSMERTFRLKIYREFVKAADFLWCPGERNPNLNQWPCLKPGTFGK